VILSIDPGSKNAGVAVYNLKGELAKAWLAQGKDWVETASAVIDGLPVSAIRIEVVIIERMQIYDSTPLAHANDCITLSLMAGRVTGVLSAEVVTYYPNTWKGQVPKDIMTERIKNKLTKAEHKRIVLPGKALQHNVYDGAGIGLYYLKKKGIRL
jgi:hypothetical protein